MNIFIYKLLIKSLINLLKFYEINDKSVHLSHLFIKSLILFLTNKLYFLYQTYIFLPIY